ncbi:hypothetical protein B0H10DRAFT_2098677 [Mycena sp. CBHHK59/15]|nr:hypothetical protein B0H10DRAFT_2098677 [Mycena sp. CBHHK59/15]
MRIPRHTRSAAALHSPLPRIRISSRCPGRVPPCSALFPPSAPSEFVPSRGPACRTPPPLPARLRGTAR